jgi:hypothetical protein
MVKVRVKNGEIARVFAGLAVLASVTGCYDVKSVDPGVEVLPDRTGRVDATQNPLGIQGQWYAYGDSYDSQSCLRFGMHGDLCSQVYWPPPSEDVETCDGSDLTYTTFPLGFANRNGVMCTEGQVGLVVPCAADVLNCDPNTKDYSNMWGAGIGLDFDLDPNVSGGMRDPIQRKPWDAEAHGVAGVAFDLQLIDDGGKDEPYMRVEFPTVLPQDSTVPSELGKHAISLRPCVDPTAPGTAYPDTFDTNGVGTPSEEYPEGSSYADAPPVYGGSDGDVSHVHTGHNEIRWSDVHKAPGTSQAQNDYDFTPSQLLGIQFHVPSFPPDSKNPGPHFSYGFCISNLTFLRQ